MDSLGYFLGCMASLKISFHSFCMTGIVIAFCLLSILAASLVCEAMSTRVSTSMFAYNYMKEPNLNLKLKIFEVAATTRTAEAGTI